MAQKRDLSLSERTEEVRSPKPMPIQFPLEEILQHFTGNMDTVKAQYAVADRLEAEGRNTDRDTVWRSQIVLAEGLLDFYIHELSKLCLYRMFVGNWQKSEKYSNFMVPMSSVEEAIASVESRDWFFNYLNSRFSRDVFLSCESMKDQLNLIGVGFTETMEKAYPNMNQSEACKKGANIVTCLFARRNAIAHQNDRDHATAVQRPITKAEVEQYITNIETIVNAMHSVAVGKDNAANE